jgi:uncharacterized protein
MGKASNSTSSILIEIVLAVGLYFALKALLRDLDFGVWQSALFGSAPITALILFFLVPMIFAVSLNRPPADIGLGLDRFGWSTLKAFQAALFVLPATFLFPVVSQLGYSAFGWPGAAILAAGFFGAGLAFLYVDRKTPVTAPQGAGIGGLVFYLALFGAGLAAMHYLQTVSPIAARIIGVILFVAILEEFFFRGYLQSRLNDAFGTPATVFGVQCGFGLILASVAFGLFHPLSDTGDMRWPWALWTAAFGLILGLLREKTGSIWAPGLLHGLILIPSVFAAPAA